MSPASADSDEAEIWRSGQECHDLRITVLTGLVEATTAEMQRALAGSLHSDWSVLARRAAVVLLASRSAADAGQTVGSRVPGDRHVRHHDAVCRLEGRHRGVELGFLGRRVPANRATSQERLDPAPAKRQ